MEANPHPNEFIHTRMEDSGIESDQDQSYVSDNFKEGSENCNYNQSLVPINNNVNGNILNMPLPMPTQVPYYGPTPPQFGFIPGDPSLMNPAPAAAGCQPNSFPTDLSTSFTPTHVHVVPVSMVGQNTSGFVPLRFLLPESFSKAILTPFMNGILPSKWIAESSGCSVAIMQNIFQVPGHSWRGKMLVLFGDVKNYKVALKCILALLSQQLNLLMFGNIPFTSIREATNELVGNDGQTLALRLITFNSITGRLIGKQGRNLKETMDATNTQITISSDSYDWNEAREDRDRIVHIVGGFENVLDACDRIARKLHSAFINEYKSAGSGYGPVASDFVLPCQIRQPNSPQYSSSSSFRKGNNNVKSDRKYQKGYNNSSQLALPPTQKTQPFDFDSQQQTNSNGNNNNNYYLDTPADARHGMMQFSASAIASKIVRNMTMAMNDATDYNNNNNSNKAIGNYFDG